MSNYNQQLDALSLQTNQAITVKNTTDSIDPIDVGGSITAITEFLKIPLGKINEFDILVGTIPPVQTQGIEDDMYIQGGPSLVFWKKDNNAWVNKGTVSLGINIIDGNINVQPSISGTTVTASAGQWGIDNVIYQIATQSQFNLSAADLNFNRIDALFANKSSTITYTAGVASANPDSTKPVTPNDEVIICYVYVPSISSGQLPYIIDGNNTSVVTPAINTTQFTQSDLLDLGGGNWYLPITLAATELVLAVSSTSSGTKDQTGFTVVDGKIFGFSNDDGSGNPINQNIIVKIG